MTITKGASDVMTITKGAIDEFKITLQSQYVLKNSLGSQVASGSLNTGGDININYVTPVTCRSVELSFASDTLVYIGGVAIGDPLIFEGIGHTPRLIQEIRSAYRKTVGGQVIGRQVRSLKTWNITLPIITNSKRQEIETMIQSVGNYRTFFADLYEDNHGLELPIFCHMTNGGTFPRITHNNEYSSSMTISEAR
jgi:hypothetical protein